MRPKRAKDAFTIEKLYRQHGSSLLLFASAITGERSRAQDMVQQVFVKLLENGNLHQVADVKAYLFGCVRNAALNENKARQRVVALEDEPPWFVPPNQECAKELSLRQALCSLPFDQRQVIIMHIWGGLTFSQIGVLLGININTAASRYRYALAKLRETICTEDPGANPR